MKTKIIKYPSTQHIEGSNLQYGDSNKKVPFSQLERKHLVVEEKVDGSQSGFSFSSDGELLLQSRGHFLIGHGWGERQFDLFKKNIKELQDDIFDAIENRYIVFGEWMYEKHTVFYDDLPSYFMEFDVYDKEKKIFLSTDRRKEIIGSLPIDSVKVLHSGVVENYDDLVSFVGKSAFQTDSVVDNFRKACERSKVNYDDEVEKTDLSGLMEGLYIKVEFDGIVNERYKWVREDFTQRILDNDEHYSSKPTIRNKLGQSNENGILQKHRSVN